MKLIYLDGDTLPFLEAEIFVYSEIIKIRCNKIVHIKYHNRTRPECSLRCSLHKLTVVIDSVIYYVKNGLISLNYA